MNKKYKYRVEEAKVLLAEFMGYESFKGKLFHPKSEKPSETLIVEELQYDSSWDWLLPVCKKFKKLKIDHHLYRSLMQEIDESIIDEYDVIQAFWSVVYAITWYNKRS